MCRSQGSGKLKVAIERIKPCTKIEVAEDITSPTSNARQIRTPRVYNTPLAGSLTIQINLSTSRPTYVVPAHCCHIPFEEYTRSDRGTITLAQMAY